MKYERPNLGSANPSGTPRRRSHRERRVRRVSWCVVIFHPPGELYNGWNPQKVGGLEDVLFWIGWFAGSMFNFQGCIVKFMNFWWIWMDSRLGFMNWCLGHNWSFKRENWKWVSIFDVLTLIVTPPQHLRLEERRSQWGPVDTVLC